MTARLDQLPIPGVPLLVLLMLVAGLASCNRASEQESNSIAPPSRDDPLFRVGAIAVYESDLTQRLQDRYDGRTDRQTRQAALQELVRRARYTQAALDAGLADDPIVRDAIGRLLEARLREKQLAPEFEAQHVVPPQRLRELYDSQLSRFRAPERRKVAVLWLDPGSNQQRALEFAEKLSQAREFVLQNKDLLDHPENGFSFLGADFSEHAPSRFRHGVVGWMQREGGSDPWTRAVADIAFTLEPIGALSQVITRPEGVFLVRLVDRRPAVTRSFESVAAELQQAERTRMRRETEAAFEQLIEAEYKVEWVAMPPSRSELPSEHAPSVSSESPSSPPPHPALTSHPRGD